MLLLTCATHLMAVTIVRNYWQHPWLGLLRAICISGVFIFTGLLFVNQTADKSSDLPEFPTDVPPAAYHSSLLFLPAACFESGNSSLASKTLRESTANASRFKDVMLHTDPGNRIHGWNLYLVTLLFFMAAILAEGIRFLRRGRERPRWRSRLANKLAPVLYPFRKAKKLMSGIFLLYLIVGIGISAASTIEAGSYIFHLRSWVYSSGWIQFENNSNPEQDATDFGQLVPIFMSALIVFSFLQIVSGGFIVFHLMPTHSKPANTYALNKDKMTEHLDHVHENDPEGPYQGEHVPFIDPSKTTLVILNNTDTAYQGPQVATPGTYDINSIWSTWDLSNSKNPSCQVSTVDIASPGLGITNYSPLLYSRGSQESIDRSHASANVIPASSSTPGSGRSSNLGTPGTPPLSSSPGTPPTSRSFSIPRPLRPGYSPLNHQLGAEHL